MRLDMHSRQEILNANVKDYQKALKKGCKELLDRLVPVTGINRSYLATALGNYGKKRNAVTARTNGRKKPRPEGTRTGHPVIYGDEYGKPCGKLLVPMIGSMIQFLQESKNPEYGITGEIKELLLKVSATEADILLKPARKAREIKLRLKDRLRACLASTSMRGFLINWQKMGKESRQNYEYSTTELERNT